MDNRGWTETEDGSSSPYEFLLCSLLGSFAAVFICYRLRQPCLRQQALRTNNETLLTQGKYQDDDHQVECRTDSDDCTLESVMTQKERKKAKLKERDQRFRTRSLKMYKETQRGTNDDISFLGEASASIEIVQDNGEEERIRATEASVYRSPICGIYSGTRTQSTFLISPNSSNRSEMVHDDNVRVTLIFKPSLRSPGFEVEGVGSDFVSDFDITRGFVNYHGDICWFEERYKNSLPSSMKCARGLFSFQEDTESHKIQIIYEANDGIIKGSITLSLLQRLDVRECLRRRKFSVLKNSMMPRSIFRGKHSEIIAVSVRSRSNPCLDGDTRKDPEVRSTGVNRYLARATELNSSPLRTSPTSSVSNLDVLSSGNDQCSGELLVDQRSNHKNSAGHNFVV